MKMLKSIGPKLEPSFTKRVTYFTTFKSACEVASHNY